MKEETKERMRTKEEKKKKRRKKRVEFLLVLKRVL